VTTRWHISRDWLQFASGDEHVCAIDDGQRLWCWGANSSGQLGDTTLTDRDEPTQIGLDTDWSVVAIGSQHNCALKNDASLWCWGSNSYGELGDSTTSSRNSPTPIATLFG